MGSLETRSRDVQEKTFCKWYVFCRDIGEGKLRPPVFRLNTKLESNGYSPMTSLVKDLSDGVKLIQLMVCPTFGLLNGILTRRIDRKLWACLMT